MASKFVKACVEAMCPAEPRPQGMVAMLNGSIVTPGANLGDADGDDEKLLAIFGGKTNKEDQKKRMTKIENEGD